MVKFITHLGDGVVVAGYSDSGGLLFRSTDYGLSWDNGRAINDYHFYPMVFMDGSTVYLPVGNALYASEDKGATWNLKFPKANFSDIVFVGKSQEGTVVTIGFGGYLYWGYEVTA